MATSTTEIWGFNVTPQVGRWVKPDGWPIGVGGYMEVPW